MFIFCNIYIISKQTSKKIQLSKIFSNVKKKAFYMEKYCAAI